MEPGTPNKRQKKHHSNFLLALLEEVIHLLFHSDLGVFKKANNLLNKPGTYLVKYSKEKNGLKKASAYFLVALTIYFLLSHFVFQKLGFQYFLSTRFDNHIASLLLLGLLFGIAIAGYISLGMSPIRFKDKSDYSFPQVLVICLYIYGTNYFLAPIVIIISTYFDDALFRYFPHDDGTIKGKITDIPLAIFMVFMVFRLIKETPHFRHLYLRFLIFVLLAFTYYNYMFDIVFSWAKDSSH